MSTISSIGSAASAWSDLTSSRAAARKDKMFAKADTNGDGTVDTTELQSMLDDIASKTGTTLGNASDLMSKMDTDGNGTLSKDELAQGMKSLMPTPSSTVDFAQQRSGADALFSQLDSDSSGGLNAGELNKLLDQIASGTSSDASTADTSTTTGTAATDGTSATSATSTDSVVATAEAAVFSKIDTNGDGTISKAEFDAAVSGTAQGGHHGHMHGGHMPPPPDASSSSDTSTTSTDPLDTNGDGVVSAAELAAGQFNDLVSSLSSALDSSGTSGLSATQADAFKSQFDSAIAAMTSAGSSSDSGSSTGGNASTSQQQNLDLSALADLVLKRYSQASASQAQTAAFSISA